MGRPKLPRIILPPDTKRVCIHCNNTYLIGEFVKDKPSSTGYHNFCKYCHARDVSRRQKTPTYRARKNQRSKERYRLPEAQLRREETKTERNAKRRKHFMKYQFGLTPDEVAYMRDAQCNLCEICHQAFEKTPHIDHNHATGQVRGLLCHNCNYGLGQFKDDPQRLASAIEYLMIYD